MRKHKEPGAVDAAGKDAQAIDTPSRIAPLGHEAALVLIAAANFGMTDSITLGLPTSRQAGEGITFSAHKEADGTVVLVTEPNRNGFDSGKWRVEQLDQKLMVARRQLATAKDQVAKNANATPDMMGKLQANVDKLQAAFDELESERQSIFDREPAILRDRLENEGKRLLAHAEGLDKKALEQVANAAQWRAKGPDFPTPEAVEHGSPNEDRNEARAKVCETEATRLQSQADAARNKALDILDQAKGLPALPEPTSQRFSPGTVIPIQF